MYRRIAAFAVAGLLLSGQAVSAAQGARITGVTGSVMVSQNGRFVPASSGAALRAGDRIVATSGSARVTWADGCNVAVSARSMMIVGAASPCTGGSSNVVRVSTQSTPSESDRSEEASADESSADIWECSILWQCEHGSETTLWLAFGVVTTAAVATALDDDSDPASP